MPAAARRPGAAGATGGGGRRGAPPVSKYIVVDQFGYLPDGEKIAVIRDPQTGFDAGESSRRARPTRWSTPPAARACSWRRRPSWNGGATDASSGDKAWWFTFTSVTTPGEYYVLDVDRNVRSYPFQIGDQVYRNVLKQAVRMLLLPARRAEQDRGARRRGLDRRAPASRARCRISSAACYNDKHNAATERDLRGGWYDAGDLNKYTSWTAGYVETLLRAYAENPAIWTDDYSIPESGNGIPDVLDEAKWGLDFLVRMQSSERLGAQHRGRAVGQPAVGGDRAVPLRAGEHVGDAGHRRRVRGRRAHPEAARQRRAEHRSRRSADARAQRLDVGGREPGRHVQEQRQRVGIVGARRRAAGDRRLRAPGLQAGRGGAALRRHRRRDLQDLLRRATTRSFT